MTLTKELFTKLSIDWHRETDGCSSVQKKIEHPAYKEIVSYGFEAVPFILEEMQGEGGHWFIALHEITGANPIRGGASLKGLTLQEWPTWDECVNSWVEWGKTNGYA